MFYAFLVTCEAANALSRKGCRHFEAFDQGNENFDREVFQVKDVVLKRSTEALYDWVWGSYDRVVVKERAGRALEQVKAFFRSVWEAVFTFVILMLCCFLAAGV